MSDQAETEPATETADVVIVGAGPTGLLLAAELCLAGVVPVVLDRLPEPSQIPKGNGMIGQIVTVLDYRGLLDGFRAASTYCGPAPGFGFGPLTLDLARLDRSPLHIIAIPQRRIEELLAVRLGSLGGSVRRGHELIALRRHDDYADLEFRVAAGRTCRLRTRYVAGCDGAHSAVRKLSGIGFPGMTSGEVSRIGRVRLPASMIVAGTAEVDVPGLGRLGLFRHVRTARGGYSIAPLAMLDKEAEPGIYIVATREDDGDADGERAVTLAELQASLDRVLGATVPLAEPQWLTRTVGNSRVADRFRSGPVVLAGDAAHLFGLGGSLNAGLLDAINLGWKLAAQVRGDAPAGLVDTYHTERHAAAERTLMHSRVQRALLGGDELSVAIRQFVGELLEYREPLRHVGEMLEASDVRYEMPGNPEPGHPLAGRLMPDIRISVQGQSTRIAELMRAARPVLLDFSRDHRAGRAAERSGHHVRVAIASALDQPPPADALLIRPDGYVAWTTDPDGDGAMGGLEVALRTWCGPAG